MAVVSSVHRTCGWHFRRSTLCLGTHSPAHQVDLLLDTLVEAQDNIGEPPDLLADSSITAEVVLGYQQPTAEQSRSDGEEGADCLGDHESLQGHSPQ